MSSWYYAEGNSQRRGPVTDAVMLGLYRDQEIALDTLVWREGLDQWLPLSACADALGPPISTDLHSAAVPPPLAVAAPGAQPASPVAPHLRQAAKGPTWPLLLVLGAVAGLFVVVAAIGVLAAIAVPAYKDYQTRAKVTEAVAALAPLKPQIADFLSREGRCPENGDAGFQTPEHYATGVLTSVQIGRFDTSACGVEALLHAPGSPKIDGKALWLELDAEAGTWQCSSEIDDTELPQDCRG
ncbi:pilus assembly protein PilA [Xanthomonas vesicatoria ATCC 35937]|uniref:Tfp pilus assembly protein, major pilin PilA n=1 Tax=Xanthomonas vesicatoria ATCC 35937 TaxID=925775 RepID=F0B7L4_9XANT|nr:pilin [Xanthomonas vesicatoria]APP75510.1 pilus assembly protein PilA [Xanthomonas vesicatoria ATCC 35937]EGD11550.1 Tfp pilus assembly protein, major pilin PilA [Xanthomonas vesicatoria ATCC 35937]KTF31637.1 PilA [Xanthomonas vesicatoria]MCC8599131.1 pilin [Xanthomonas vesicatoria]MCC8603879.1 pilin [Xanthomonas vesicatoria]